MSTKLIVGFCRKKGLPEFGSIGANCSIEIELDGHALSDSVRLQNDIGNAFSSVRTAVEQELDRKIGHQYGQQPRCTQTGSPRNGISRPATDNQIRAIKAIAKRTDADLPSLLGNFGVSTVADLTIANASSLIDKLKQSIAPVR